MLTVFLRMARGRYALSSFHRFPLILHPSPTPNLPGSFKLQVMSQKLKDLVGPLSSGGIFLKTVIAISSVIRWLKCPGGVRYTAPNGTAPRGQARRSMNASIVL